jgi:hypothetical protein
VDAAGQLDEPRRLVDDLVLAAEDVGVVLHEAAHPHQPVQAARRLIPVTRPELGHAERQLAVRPLALIEDLHVARAVHRLEGQLLALDRLAHEHVGPVFFPVPGRLPEFSVQHLGRLDLDVARGVQPAAHVGLDDPPQYPALGVPEDHAAAFLLHVEQVHRPSQLAVVALLRLLDARQVRVQVLPGRPGGAVDALQLLAPGVAPPIGAGQLGQLEGLADVPRGGEVRPPAQVDPLALLVQGDRLILRQVPDQLGLELLAPGLEELDRVVPVPDLALELRVAVDDPAHLLLDGGEVVGRERLLAEEVVIESVLDRRADGHLGAGEQGLNGLGQHVRGVVADRVQRLGVVTHDQAEVAAGLQLAAHVALLAVQLGQQGLLGQRRRDGRRHVAGRRSGRILAHGAVWEFQFDHSSGFFGGTGS